MAKETNFKSRQIKITANMPCKLFGFTFGSVYHTVEPPYWERNKNRCYLLSSENEYCFIHNDEFEVVKPKKRNNGK